MNSKFTANIESKLKTNSNTNNNINVEPNDNTNVNVNSDSNIRINSDINSNINITDSVFKIARQNPNKLKKKAVQIYLNGDTTEKLETIAKQVGKSKNELMTDMIEWCIKNYEITE